MYYLQNNLLKINFLQKKIAPKAFFVNKKSNSLQKKSVLNILLVS